MKFLVLNERGARITADLVADVVIVGGGAAGLATAIFTRRHAPNLRVVCLDGARRVGAKILVSGGSRCNVTNRLVTERDFWGGQARVIRSVLRAFPAAQTAGFFADLGVALHEEVDGKLFPDTNRARTVLDALLDEMLTSSSRSCWRSPLSRRSMPRESGPRTSDSILPKL